MAARVGYLTPQMLQAAVSRWLEGGGSLFDLIGILQRWVAMAVGGLTTASEVWLYVY